MAWGKDNEEEKKKAAEQSAAERDELVNTLRTSFEETLKTTVAPLQEKINQYETRFSTIEENTRKPAAKQEDRVLTDILDNPDVAINERLAPTQMALIDLNARMVERDVCDRLKEQGFGEYVPKVKEFLSTKVSGEEKARAAGNYSAFVENVAMVLIGRDATAKGLKYDGSKQTFFLEDSTTGNRSADNQKYGKLVEAGTDGQFDLKINTSDEAVAYAKKLGVKDIDKFLKEMA